MSQIKMSHLLHFVSGFAVAALLAGPTYAQMTGSISTPAKMTVVGQLDCTLLPETRENAVVRSTAKIQCLYESADGLSTAYDGEVGVSLGLDLRLKEADRLVYSVVLSEESEQGQSAPALEGKYVGGSALTSLGLGLLVRKHSGVALRPKKATAGQTPGISLGLEYIHLEKRSRS